MAKDVKHIRIEIPKSVHSILKIQAVKHGKTFAQWIQWILVMASTK